MKISLSSDCFGAEFWDWYFKNEKKFRFRLFKEMIFQFGKRYTNLDLLRIIWAKETFGKRPKNLKPFNGAFFLEYEFKKRNRADHFRKNTGAYEKLWLIW